jgi:hypothetical protein
MTEPSSSPAICNCLALRQAARQVTQFYDRFLAPSGVRATQYSILAKLKRAGPMSINALAADMVMDRTTLGSRARAPRASRRHSRPGRGRKPASTVHLARSAPATCAT